MLLKKRGDLIEQFSKNNIISKNEKFYDAPKKSEKEYQNKNLIDQFLNGCKSQKKKKISFYKA